MPAALPGVDWWRGRRALVTGHTGFVGGWLCAWLAQCGARVSGLSLPPPTTPSFFERARIATILARSTIADVRDPSAVAQAIRECDPQVVFHLAAQPLVREAHRDPVTTFATNVMGTVNVLEACRGHASIERLVVYTTDKVYRNNESGGAFSEADRLGGNEPYSASKAAADWAVAAYWTSYLRASRDAPGVAIVRAGNILGGGDWARERLVPDAVRAFTEKRALEVRNPDSSRPWQHVLDVVRGTLVLAERLPRAESAEALAWNLGPSAQRSHSVAEVATLAAAAWGEGAGWRAMPEGSIPESRALGLSSEKARRALGWRCAWDVERAIAASIAWYKAALEGDGDPLHLAQRQIEEHAADARRVLA
jgi:CDP-glucose 4,6-dehydratase